MKKVKLLKDHMQHKKGDVIEVPNMRAAYWQATGVVTLVTGQVETKVVETTKETPKKKKK